MKNSATIPSSYSDLRIRLARCLSSQPGVLLLSLVLLCVLLSSPVLTRSCAMLAVFKTIQIRSLWAPRAFPGHSSPHAPADPGPLRQSLQTLRAARGTWLCQPDKHGGQLLMVRDHLSARSGRAAPGLRESLQELVARDATQAKGDWCSALVRVVTYSTTTGGGM